MLFYITQSKKHYYSTHLLYHTSVFCQSVWVLCSSHSVGCRVMQFSQVPTCQERVMWTNVSSEVPSSFCLAPSLIDISLPSPPGCDTHYCQFIRLHAGHSLCPQQNECQYGGASWLILVCYLVSPYLSVFPKAVRVYNTLLALNTKLIFSCTSSASNAWSLFTCSLRVHIGFLQDLQFPPTSPKHTVVELAMLNFS